MSSYRKIVFGLKLGKRIGDCQNILKLFRSSIVVISEHVTTDKSYHCGRSGLHYHGLVELPRGMISEIELMFRKLGSFCCYFKEEKCSDPANSLANVILSPKRIVFQTAYEPTRLSAIKKEVTQEYCLQERKRRNEKCLDLIEQNKGVTDLIDKILKTGLKDPNAFINRFQNDENVKKLNMRGIFITIFTQALQVVHRIVLSSSILDLCNRVEVSSKEYLSLNESVEFVQRWCRFQEINPKEFTENWIRCLNKKNSGENCLYFHGAPNSGKTYITRSIMDACIFVENITLETTGYSFVWQNCIGKRLIVMTEPYFDINNCDQLEKILEGSGTLVYKQNSFVDYLHPTPIVIIANKHGWEDYPALGQRICERFICRYTNLKTFPMNEGKKLHPGWLKVLSDFYRLEIQNPNFYEDNLADRSAEPSNTGVENANGFPSTSNGSQGIRTARQGCCDSSFNSNQLFNPDRNVTESFTPKVDTTQDPRERKRSTLSEDRENFKKVRFEDENSEMESNGTHLGKWKRLNGL